MEIKHKITDEVLLTIGGDSLKGADLQWADLRGANLQGANLQGADLQWANLQGANLQGANLQGANLQGANLLMVNLRGVNLRVVNLQGADLRYANLQGADLQGADLPTDVIRIDGMRWDVTISQDWMSIGCQHHHIDKWNKFTDDEISKMDDNALEFWQANKHKLITIANFTKE